VTGPFTPTGAAWTALAVLGWLLGRRLPPPAVRVPRPRDPLAHLADFDREMDRWYA
jgi:hypothetical protein